jgi:acyl carrier protein
MPAIRERTEEEPVAELDHRLVRCILSVFPTLTEKEGRAAKMASLMDVDSLAAVTLVALIDEEFGVDIDLEGLLRLGSFEALQQFLASKLSQRCPAAGE